MTEIPDWMKKNSSFYHMEKEELSTSENPEACLLQHLPLTPRVRSLLKESAHMFFRWEPQWIEKNFSDVAELSIWATDDDFYPQWLIKFLTEDLVDTALKRTWLQEGFLKKDSKWLHDLMLREKAKVGRCFLLTGNIGDYAFDASVGYQPFIHLLGNSLNKKKEIVLRFSLSQGLRVFPEGIELSDRIPKSLKCLIEQGSLEINQPMIPQICHLFDQLRRILEDPNVSCTKGIAIIFENVHLLFSSHAQILEQNFLVDALLNWSNSPKLFQSPHCLILVAESLAEISDKLQAQGGKFESIEVKRPASYQERLKFILPLLSSKSQLTEIRFAMEAYNISLKGYQGNYIQKVIQLAHDTAGLNFMGIEDLFQQAVILPEKALTRSFVLDHKREILKVESKSLLEVEEPVQGLESIGGYKHITKRIRETIYSFCNASDGLARECCPMGILLLGPPGTGKSIAAKAIASESGVSFAKFGKIRGEYVGQSENNLSRVLSLIRSLSPVIVFIDEIDQAIGGRDDSNGVDRRLFAQLLEFMSDTSNRGKVLWVAASNCPKMIDPALKRAGRLDLILPFLLPDKESRCQIFEKLLNGKLAKGSYSINSLNNDDYEILASKTDGFSGAEIEGIIGEVLRRKTLKNPDGRIVVDLQDFLNVLKVFKPSKDKLQYQRMEEEAIEHVAFLDLLSESDIQRFTNTSSA